MLIGEDAIATGVDVNSVNTSGFTPKDVLELMLQSGDESSLYDVVEMFHHTGALKSGEMITTNYHETLTACHRNDQANDLHPDANPSSGTVPSFSSGLSNIWKELTKEIEESSMESQNALMVVAVLIATLTYQAMLSPPSGILSAESKRPRFGLLFTRRSYAAPGEAAMANDPEVFALFTVFNGIGFIASIGMISLLTNGFPLRAGLRLAILSMTATFVIGAFYVAPMNDGTVYVVVELMEVVVLVEFAPFMLWLLRKWGVLPIKTSRSCSSTINRSVV
ncbi:uncharacterized protein LOC122294647 [Carya illinoinensis]|uniref:PGG domain-containing protein n=1 Tax=Carya illinoinensis TaxID=32201 RepID=A0A8T1NI02_CARIL|nr:uncharacterized protein LOC122294647 [Carya illinoinensis]KAG6628523.1 hypothetical protein CIPAW_14G019100 [Carya illinoinensis]KAG6677348.1 hypothetical protein I3842_14G021500 [Carya illinoinensis]